MRFLEIKYIAYSPDSKIIYEKLEKSIVVPVGKKLIYPFLDEALSKAEPGKKYKFEFKKPFGDRKKELIRIVPLREFIKRGIKPRPGLIVNINGFEGIVRSVSGRVVVDFNHPLAGEDIVYEVEIIREIKDDIEKLKYFINFLTKIPLEKIEILEDGDKIKIKFLEDYPILNNVVFRNFLLKSLKEIVHDKEIVLSSEIKINSNTDKKEKNIKDQENRNKT